MKNSVYLVFCLGIFSASYRAYGMPSPDDDYNNDDIINDDLVDDYDDEPKMVSRNENYTVAVGATVSLPCKIEGEDPVVQWTYSDSKREKKPVRLFFGTHRQEADHRIYLSADFTLTISNANLKDSGQYKCILGFKNVTENELNSVMYYVRVGAPTPKIAAMRPANSQTLMIGQPMTFMCEGQGKHKLDVYWLRELKYLNRNETINSREIKYDKVKPEHAGRYTCVVKNRDGKDMKTVDLIVLAPPVMSAERRVVTTSENFESELKCISAPNNEKIEVTWYRDGQQIIPNDKNYFVNVNGDDKSVKQYTLRIIPTKKNDLGTYECTGVNKYGRNSSVIMLIDEPLPPVLLSGNPSGDNGYVLTYMSESQIKFLNYEMAYKRQQDDDWIYEKNALGSNENVLEFSHTFKDLSPHTYEAKVRVNNLNGWSLWSEVTHFSGQLNTGHNPASSINIRKSYFPVVILLIFFFLN
ncbi:neural cell adhesion molecule 1-like isoform X2 [Cimex lectularius]|uniref:Ig-like domain-containing protein n=1 Tax=Cimex lectularius TaxID=79782 RepID=A0A8I6RMD3_CIMLE|nr:neural cell adhesion molecule 1-like isoform X2 [Cimex lectularius]